MKKITINISDRVLSNTEWSTVRDTMPTFYKVEGSGACLVLPGATYNVYFSDALVINNIFSQNSAKETLPAPNHGISESFILKAMAIAQNPNLAMELTR